MTSARPSTLVVRTAGTNCDLELCRAFALAGSSVDLVHVDRVVEDPSLVDRASIVAFPGGFSYGDDIASGRVLAAQVRDSLYPALVRAVERGAPIIGVCNGFQVLVQAGLLPGPGAGEAWPETPARQTISVTHNAGARFVDRWVGVEADPASHCVWTASLANDAFPEGTMTMPVAHGEGRVVFADGAMLDAMVSSGRIPLRYGENFNGSAGAAAGVCDASGLVFGLMPHPERYLDWRHHPFWTRLPKDARRGRTPGLSMFASAVEHAAANTALV